MQWAEYRNTILANIDNEAFFLNELKQIDRRGNELKASCPFAHKHSGGVDNNPSFTANLAKGTYYCNVCGSKGNVHTFTCEKYNMSKQDAWLYLGDALKIERPSDAAPARPEIEPALVTEWHKRLMELSGPIRKMIVERRGLTDDTLAKFQLGWDGERITIPVYDEYNTLVNIRRYKWNSDDDTYKVTNYVDEYQNKYGEVRIFGLERLLDDSEYIVWSEGEMDRITAEQHGFPAACATSGAGTLKPEWIKYFKKKKRVYLAQDNDKKGREANESLANKLYRVTDVYILQWPDGFPEKGDITDFFTRCGQTAEDFQKLLDGAVKYTKELTKEEQAKEDASEVHLADSSDAQFVGKRIKVPVMVSGKVGTPFLCPEKIKISCGTASDADNKKCKNCALATYGGEMNITMNASNVNTLSMFKCSDKQQKAAIYEMTGVSANCDLQVLTIEKYMNIDELRIIPKAEANFGFAKEHEYTVRHGYYIGKDLKTNKRYMLNGYMHPDPQTQLAQYLFDDAMPDKDLIEDFTLTDDIVDTLQIFQCGPGQSIEDKFNEIHYDLENNVTRIWERRDVAFAVDLIYHTAMNFNFQGDLVKRGWGELLIIGDSGQAKTTLVEKLMAHYRLGEMYSGESSKRTGLVYNLQQTSRTWFLTWGAFPLNDGGLVAIDELSGLPEDDLAIMSDVRSSGLAKATGVITAETTARTRAIYISNPRNGRQLNTETYGVNAILKLMGKSEDVRRLDVAIAVASGDVDPTLVNRDAKTIGSVQHRYTSDICNTRTLWAWSRRPENIKITDEATQCILQHAIKMGQKYSSKVPIVEAADQRLKIARLAVSAAACVFSTSDGTDVVVKPEHVEFVVNFMDRIYCTKSMGYDKMSEQEQQNSDTSDDNIIKLRKMFLSLPLMDNNEIASILYQLPYFSRATLEDYTGLDKDSLRILLKFLTTQHLVDKVRGDYRRLPLGTELLQNLVDTKANKDELKAARDEAYGAGEY